MKRLLTSLSILSVLAFAGVSDASAHHRDGNRTVIYQKGFLNKAVTAQYGKRNKIYIKQRGNNNEAFAEQDGTANKVKIKQTGDGNYASVYQNSR